jgi:hypothetical protein
MSPASNQIDRNPANASDLARRLIARIVLKDTDDEPNRQTDQRAGSHFWNEDFPRMSVPSLMPKSDQLLDGFSRYADQIDEAMHRICQS